MKKFRLLSWLCVLIALLLSHFMCINVSFNYARMLCQIEHAGASAPASIAFLSATSYLIGIVLFAVSAAFFIENPKNNINTNTQSDGFPSDFSFSFTLHLPAFSL